MATGSAAHLCSWIVLLMCLLESEGASICTDKDILPPSIEGHDPSNSQRLVRDDHSVTHGRTAYETWPSSSHDGLPVAESTVFTSDTTDSTGTSHWLYGHMTVVHDPLRTLSVVEPGGPGGCERSPRVTVEETAVRAGCLYAQNAGFFNTTSFGCLGNVVSDGRMVRDSRGVKNAQFGIRKDGSLVFGYLSQEDVLDRSNPFVQLVSGLVWLLRNGEVYINQSLEVEFNKIVDIDIRYFVDVLSARTVVGHDAKGNVVLFHVDGETLKRGMNLWEVAEFLKKNGVINAINLDGGGSSSFVVNGTLASYPPDICESDSRWRCARRVSTILCVHQRRCQPADCGRHGVCTANGCVCAAGWRGKNCSKVCPPGFYGLSCSKKCQCDDQCPCDPLTGSCTSAGDGTLNRAGLYLAMQMFALCRRQHEDTCRGELYLTEQTWLIITVTLASLLLIRQLLHVMRAGRRWLLFCQGSPSSTSNMKRRYTTISGRNPQQMKWKHTSFVSTQNNRGEVNLCAHALDEHINP